MIAVIESEPLDGPLHRAWNPETWFWYVPGHDDLVTVKELTAIANWQRAGGKKSDRPKRQPRPWDEQKESRKITPDSAMDTDEFLSWFEDRFAVPV